MSVALALGVAAAIGGETNVMEAGKQEIMERIVIDQVWSAVPVRFCLLTHGDRQYVAYYNADRRMVAAMRKLSEKTFTRAILSSKSDHPPKGRGNSSTIQGWDSHNYITMAVDGAGDLHLAGNMHCNQLTYFRSREPGDVTTLEQIDTMVGTEEDGCTYPAFMTGPDGALIFHYRDGASGNGQEIYNVYDPATKTWRRFFETPLVSGLGKRNAYQNGPRLGPDGWYHLLWVWRETPDAATNHDLSYARSRDLRNWETAAGETITLPITIKNRGTIVDPVPVNGGIINGCHHFGFDSQQRIVITYHKHDAAGNTQAYAARWTDDAWQIRAISDWTGRHIFKGGGSGPSTFGTSLSLGAIRRHGPGELALPFSHWTAGRGLLVVAEDSLEPIRVDPRPAEYPDTLMRVTSDFPGMQVNFGKDSGQAPDAASRYVLRWETLGRNRDLPRRGALPANSELVLYRMAAPNQE